MLGYFYNLIDGGGIVGGIVGLAIFLFIAWMFIHAIMNGEYLWAVFIFIFSGLSALLYFFMVYRASGVGNPMAGFELPGAADRKRIKTLEAEIYHLDKPHLYQQLADIYFNQGKLDKAEENYRKAYERDNKDEDILAHYGSCLARLGKSKEGLPLLQEVCAKNPKHDYGYTLMTLAETQDALGQEEAALATWRQVLALYSYPRARVQFAEMLITRKDYAEARRSLEEVVNDLPYVTKFQRKREKVWFNKAKSALRSLPA